MSDELRLRIWSGLVLALVALTAIWLGGFPFRLLSCVIGLLITYEWLTIIRARETAGPGAFVRVWLEVSIIALETLASAALWLQVVTLIAFFGMEMFSARRAARSYWLPSGILYAGLTIISLCQIRGTGPSGLWLTVFVFGVVWATDIAAYFSGRALKGPKLAPRISPGKTWSGAIGGALVAVVIGAIVASVAHASLLAHAVLIAVLLSIASQIGDLFESFVKRRFGVKDSSHLIPGHGGVMDRVDGLIFAAFAAFSLALILSLLAGHDVIAPGRILLGV